MSFYLKKELTVSVCSVALTTAELSILVELLLPELLIFEESREQILLIADLNFLVLF